MQTPTQSRTSPHESTLGRRRDEGCAVGAAVDVNELDALIEEASRRGFMWHQFRVNKHGPEVLSGVFRWDRCVDVVVLSDEKGSHAYRTPADAAIDVFAPSHVHWWYGRIDDAVRLPDGMVLPGVSMAWVLRALLTLPDPDEPGGLPRLIPRAERYWNFW